MPFSTRLHQHRAALAKQRGLRVIADAKPSETELVRGYGADVVVTRADRFCSEVRAEPPGGADALFDTALLGREVSDASFQDELSAKLAGLTGVTLF